LQTGAWGEKVQNVPASAGDDLTSLVVKGKVTLFFFGDAGDTTGDRGNDLLKEHVRQVARDGDVYLRVIDVGDPDSALARKYKVPFVPCVVVYDRRGRRVGNANASPMMIEQYVQSAKKAGA